MDVENIKKLMDAMEDKGIRQLTLKDASGFELQLERESHLGSLSHRSCAVTDPSHLNAEIKEGPSEQQEKVEKECLDTGYEVTSPMVGIFYTAPSPEAPPFVKVGDVVTQETVIGIVEAMKVMNEIKAGRSGVVVEMYIDNGVPVEFGTKLLKLA